MNTFYARALVSVLAATALLSIAGEPASAADFPQRKALEAQSARSGLGVERLPVLERLAGPGREVVAERVRTRFADRSIGVTTGGNFQLDIDDERYSLIGEGGWFLTAYGDGSRIHYNNQAFVDARPELALPVEERLSEAVLESLGRAFIATELQELVQLGAGEELTPMFTEFMVQGGGSTKPGGYREPDTVLASTMVFSRTVGGVAVVGSGSKIAVTFANDQTPVAFDVDWAPYRTTSQVQEILPLDDILARSLALRDGTGEENLERIECGYFDLGSRLREASAPVQGACFLHVSIKTQDDDGHFLSAFGEAVPAAVSVIPDSAWPEALHVLGLPAPPDAPAPDSGPVASR